MFECVGRGISGAKEFDKEVPALVLLDLVMPNLSGTDVLDQMRADEIIFIMNLF